MLKKSINPLTKMSYEIPELIDDSEEIKKFVKLHKDKKIIVVQGLGFVGAVMSLVCANSSNNEYAVIGIDLPNEQNFWKIKSINEGIFPLIAEDPKIKTFFEESKKRKNFYATYDPTCFQLADIIIVDINLDVQKQSNKDLALDKFTKLLLPLGAFTKILTFFLKIFSSASWSNFLSTILLAISILFGIWLLCT